MVTNRSRAYPRRSGKRDVRLEISVFGFEGTTETIYKKEFYSLNLRSFLFVKIFIKNDFFICFFLILCYNHLNKYVKVFYNAVRWLNGL